MARYVAMYVGHGKYDGVRVLKSPTVDAMFALRNSMPITEGASSKLSYPKMFWGGGLGWQVRDYRSRKQVLHPGSAGSVVVLCLRTTWASSCSRIARGWACRSWSLTNWWIGI